MEPIQSEHKPTLASRLLAWIKNPFKKDTAPTASEVGASRAPFSGLRVLPSPIIRASVVIPALNEEKNIADVVRYALADVATAEVIVIDDSSIDETAARATLAGARVVTSTMLGKGRSMFDGLAVAQHDIIVFLDGDLSELRPGIVSDLARPIAADSADLVKASFGRSGGRVTELTAKPMLKLFFPEIAHLRQPLGGIIAVRKALMNSLTCEDGYGVDIGLLIDAQRAGARIAEVEIGSLKHESQSLQGLSHMANEVSHVIFDRAKKAGRLSVEQILSVIEMEAQNQADIDFVLQRIRRHRGIVLLPLEVVLTAESVESLLATATGRADKLRDARALTQGDAIGATHATARSFRFVHKSEFDTAAHALTLRPDSVEVVNQLRRRGYAVGVVSDGFYAIAEIVRRRVFADFAIAHTIQFAGDVCQGEASINRAFAHERGCGKHAHCMSNIIAHLREGERDVPLEHIVAVGALATHACFVEAADAGVVLDASGATLRHARGARVVHSLNALVPHLDIATPLARVA